ncbi:HepT-like ribonuclease domain-containing protein [Desulfotignum phosphitoxidans]|uniref:HepT-like ribonuclease domain-containing protein n=1 Tax=Desulfotignum phosphitoxidans TaxID=190898 RepID=UPI0009FD0DB6
MSNTREKESWGFNGKNPSKKIAGFRNFLSHDYEAVDSRIICNQILAKIGDIRKFIKQITLIAN